MHLTRRNFVVGSCLAGSAGSLGAGSRIQASPNTLFVEDFRSSGLNDRQTIARALSAWTQRGGTLQFEAGREYDVGAITNGNPIFPIAGATNGSLAGNGASIVASTRTQTAAPIFFLQNCNNISIFDFSARDRGTDLSKDWQGMRFIVIDGSLGPCRGLTVKNIEVTDAVALFCTQGAPGRRISNIVLSNLLARRCYYGVNCIENGDDLSCDIVAIDTRRAYFVYGVARHRVLIAAEHGPSGIGAQACCLIKRYTRNTSDIDLTLRIKGKIAWNDLVRLEQQPAPGSGPGRIERIRILLSIASDAQDPNNANRLALATFSNGRPAPSSNDIWRDISLAGQFGNPNAIAVRAFTRPTVETNVFVARTEGVIRFDAKGLVVKRGNAPNQPVSPRKL